MSVLVEKVLGKENEVGSKMKFKKLYNQLAGQNVKTPNKAITGNPQGYTYVMALLHVFMQQTLPVVFIVKILNIYVTTLPIL